MTSSCDGRSRIGRRTDSRPIVEVFSSVPTPQEARDGDENAGPDIDDDALELVHDYGSRLPM
jgi:hypothetical protein